MVRLADKSKRIANVLDILHFERGFLVAYEALQIWTKLHSLCQTTEQGSIPCLITLCHL